MIDEDVSPTAHFEQKIHEQAKEIERLTGILRCSGYAEDASRQLEAARKNMEVFRCERDRVITDLRDALAAERTARKAAEEKFSRAADLLAHVERDMHAMRYRAEAADRRFSVVRHRR